MCWGFDCGDGWYDIIDKLCEKIQKHCDELQSKRFGKRGVSLDDMQVEATQVKEKWGTLCFYVSGADDTVYDMIDEAEKESSYTCEDCGEVGKLREGGWVKVQCDKCYEEVKHQNT